MDKTSMVVGWKPGPLFTLDSLVVLPWVQSASLKDAGLGWQPGVKCQECRAAERPGTLSSLSTGWLGLFWSAIGQPGHGFFWTLPEAAMVHTHYGHSQ